MRDKQKKFMAILSFVLIMLTTYAYSALATNLSITGEAVFRTPADIRVTNISINNANGATSEYANFRKDTITNGFVLNSSSSTMSYDVTITNSGLRDQAIYNLITQSSNNSGLNILIDGQPINEVLPIIVPYGTSKTITITYSSSTPGRVDVVNKFDFRKVYYISYNTKGGSSIATQTKYENVDLVLTSDEPTLSGRRFLGWTDEQNGTIVKFSPGDTYTIDGDNKILYAIYSEDQYTITFDYNDGSTPSTTKDVSTGDPVGTLPTPTREGYTLEGWFTESTGGTQISAATVPNEDTTYYAHWTANKLTINYYAGGASKNNETTLSNQLLTTDTYDYDGTDLSTNGLKNYDSQSSTWNLVKEGYHADKYWHLGSASAATKVHEDTTYETNQALANAYGKLDEFKAGNITINIYAGWTTNTYTIAFDKNNENATGTMANQSMTYGTAANLTNNVYTRTGYTFIGWNTEADGTGTAYLNNESVNNLTSTNNGTVTLYAQWALTTYNITYTLNGGTNNANNPSTYTVTSNDITLLAPTKEGYVFNGWTGSNGNTPQTTVTITSGSVGNKSYTANWKEPPYIIVFNSNGGTGTMTNQSVDVGVATKLKENAFTKSGYVFIGWNTSSDGSEDAYLNKESVTDLVDSGDSITLYAQWIEAHATFLPGQEVNAKMKKLAGNTSATYLSSDTAITTITKSNTAPDITQMTEDNIVSTSTSNTPIYMWYDNGTIYWWSEDDTPYLNTDSSYMFYNCSGLTSLDVSNFDTSKVTNMSNMFYNCNGLISLDVSNFDTSKVTNMSNMFYNCSGLTSLDVSNFDTSNVTNMSFMFRGCRSITSIDVSNFDTSNVTNMSNMFYNCSGLTSLDVSNFDTSKVTYMSYMFSDCSSLTSLDVSNFDTSNITDMSSMFYNCSGLTSLDLSNFDTSKVTSMSYMFSGCSSLINLDLSNFDTSNVTSMLGMFMSCSGLTSLGVSNFDTSKVTNMSSMFYDCVRLTSLDLSSFDTSKVTNMSSMFYGISLTNLDVSNFDTSNVTDMSSMFIYCSSLTSLDVSNFDTSKVTTMSSMFRDCRSLTSLDVSNFNTSKVTNMSSMFRECRSLTTIYASDLFVTTSVTNSSSMFSSDTNLVGGAGTTYNSSYVDKTYALIDEGTSNPGYFTSITTNYTIIFDKNNENATGTMTNQTMIYSQSDSLNANNYEYDGYIFVGWNTKADGTGKAYLDEETVVALTKLSSITLYAQWIEAHATFLPGQEVNAKMKKLAGNASGTYSSTDTAITTITKSNTAPDLTQMTEDNIVSTSTSNTPIYMWYDNGTIYWWSEDDTPYLNTDSSHMFSNCRSLTGLDVSNFDTSKVTSMSYMFNNCSGLTSLDVSNFDTSNVTNMSYMFNYCRGLTSLDVSNFDTSKVTSMSDMFRDCRSLTSLDVSNFDTSNVTNMSTMFYNCSSLTSLDVSNFDTSKVTSMSDMFHNCSSLTSLDVSNFDTNKVTSMSSMFSGCSSLTSLDVSNFDTSKVTYMSSMFRDCSSLINLDLSNFNTSKVTNMSSMFNNCSSLTSLDVSNFDTNKVTNMATMFCNCRGLTSLDVSNFDTSKVTNMSWMFVSCSSLTTIYASDLFVTTNVTDSSSMFSGDANLVGGAGTTFNSSYVDKTYALIDEGTSNPGYFTDINKVYLNSYHVKFVGNGSTGGSMDEQLIEVGKTKNLNLNKFKKKGYIFNGWNTEVDGTGTAYEDGQSVNNIAKKGATIKLYAQWYVVKAVDLYYDNTQTGMTCETAQCALDNISRLLTRAGARSEGSDYLCKRATPSQLHTATVDGTTYTFGQSGTEGTLTAGDAFICDVNGDGTYSATNEMFYYVSDYYNTSTQTTNSDYATLVYYNSVSEGNPSNDSSRSDNSRKFVYDSSGENWHGPRTAMLQLPNTTLWQDIGLFKNERQILSTSDLSNYSTSTTGGTLPTNFSYKGYSGRLLTMNELKLGCQSASSTSQSLINCKYLMENTYYVSNTYDFRYALENPNSNYSYNTWFVDGNDKAIITHYNGSYAYAGVRPVIDVKKTDINLNFTTKYDVNFNKNGGTGSMSSLTVIPGDSVTLTTNTFTRTNYTFTGWNTKEDGSGTSYANGATITPDSSITLYAMWEYIPYKYYYPNISGTTTLNSSWKFYVRESTSNGVKQVCGVNSNKTVCFNESNVDFADDQINVNGTKTKALKTQLEGLLGSGTCDLTSDSLNCYNSSTTQTCSVWYYGSMTCGYNGYTCSLSTSGVISCY